MLTQAGRHIRVNTPLGEDVVFLESFEGEESISKLFSFTLGLLTSDPNFEMGSLLNKPAVVSIQLADDNDRHFHGLITEIEEVETREDGIVLYRAAMAPWLWFLSLFEDCRIFQNMTALHIVLQVFGDRGFTDFTNNTTATYIVREYCVQYRETDLNFVSRLLEEEGIFYFFTHDSDKHTLVLADRTSAFADCPGQPRAAYDTVPGLWHEEDVVLSVRRAKQVRTGKVTVNDYDFEKPNTSIDANLDSSRKGEFYEYPARYKVRDDGSRIARVRLEEQEVRLSTMTGATNCRAFAAGYKFTLTGHFRSEANQAYTLLSLHHRAASNPHLSQDEQNAFEYQNVFEAMPNAAPYHPPRLTRRPVIQGSQTAVVVGKSGEEIWTDRYGRVKVQFFWDRAGQMNENSSCWVRVSQLWAGKGWGAIYTPRIGQEVIVDFLEGDPDYPIITGRVYNADQTTPYALPDEQTKSTIKSMSSKGGGGFNEIRLEDKKGNEQIFINAEKDLHIRTKDSRFETTLGATHFHVTKDQAEKIDGDTHLKVTGDRNEKVDGTVSMNAGIDLQEKVGQNWAMDAGQEIHLKSGMNLVLESGTTLTLKVGGNFINLNSGGIFISGTVVNINSGGAAGTGAGASPHPPKDPTEADTADPGQVTAPKPVTTSKLSSQGVTTISPAAAVLRAAAQSGAAFCDT